MSYWVGLTVVALFAILIPGLAALDRARNRRPSFREIAAFAALPRKTAGAIEDARGLHLSLGSGGLSGPEGAAALVGLTMLARIAETTARSDRPPVVTSGNGATMILAQDVLRTAYDRQNAEREYAHGAVRMAGATPLSYAAGAMLIPAEEAVSLTILAGSFQSEAGLVAHRGRTDGSHVVAGADTPQAQAVLYAVADYPLIGEELYAAGAYLNAGRLHASSLQAQDFIRWLIVAALLAGAVLRTIGVM